MNRMYKNFIERKYLFAYLIIVLIIIYFTSFIDKFVSLFIFVFGGAPLVVGIIGEFLFSLSSSESQQSGMKDE